MARLLTVSSVALVSLLAAACATQPRQMARMETVSALREQPSFETSRGHEVVALSALTNGDRWTAANLLEQAVEGNPNVSSRFNLASTYHQTGRLAEAAALYRGLVNDGQFVWGTSRRDPAHQAPARRFNIADESARRLALIEARTTFAAAPLAATAAGVPAAAVVGAPPATGRISDEEALRRDGIVP